jgi:hypothetical protein
VNHVIAYDLASALIINGRLTTSRLRDSALIIILLLCLLEKICKGLSIVLPGGKWPSIERSYPGLSITQLELSA